jgi:hypothetical protein
MFHMKEGDYVYHMKEGDYMYHIKPHSKILHFARRGHLYILYKSRNKDRLFSWTKLSDWYMLCRWTSIFLR